MTWIAVSVLASGLAMDIYDHPEFWKPAGLGTVMGYFIGYLLGFQRNKFRHNSEDTDTEIR
jgi:hypothetical protein